LALAIVAELLLPERCLTLQVVHDELRTIEGGLSVRAGDTYEDDLIAGVQFPHAMDDGAREQRPALLRLGNDSLKARLRHAGVMLESKTLRLILLRAIRGVHLSYQATEGDYGTGIARLLSQRLILLI
jgi:hypothetical protein